MALTHVLTSVRLGPQEIRNRVVRPAHATMIGGGTASDDLIAYHEARAVGGVGLSIIEIMGVHPTSPGSLCSFDPRLEESYPRLVDTAHQHGMKVFQQLWHGGHNALPIDGSPPWSASDIASPLVGVAPIAMTRSMIEEIVTSFANAARLCERWGIDGVEVHCAHGYLPAQFLAQNSNKREDEYGGPLDNRVRFALEVLRAVRSAVSSKIAVGVRVAADPAVGGTTISDHTGLLNALKREALIDYVNISMGSYHASSKIIGGMHEPMGYELETSVPIAKAIGLPSIVVGRFRTLEEADQIIRSGDADLVGMVRATIADPDLVAKTMRGEAARVRPCIGCNQGCVAGLLGKAMRMGCTVNPVVGFENTLALEKARPVTSPKQILVVGGGPAGMEAARVAATRGHRVTLVEAQPNLGGAALISSMAPTRASIKDFLVWQEEELYRLGVEIKLNTYVDIDDVSAMAPDEVVIATGSSPRMDGIQISNPGEPISGVGRSNVVSSSDLFLDERRVIGETAVVVDDVGHYEAIACAERLISRGVAVSFISRLPSFGPLIEDALIVEPALSRLMNGRFTLHLRTRLIAVDDNGVLAGASYLSRERANLRIPADTVVLVSLNKPNRALYENLRTSGRSLRIVGDANSPRFLQTAIREGYLAGLAL